MVGGGIAFNLVPGVGADGWVIGVQPGPESACTESSPSSQHLMTVNRSEKVLHVIR